jgi:hypothetical protein
MDFQHKLCWTTLPASGRIVLVLIGQQQPCCETQQVVRLGLSRLCNIGRLHLQLAGGSIPPKQETVIREWLTGKENTRVGNPYIILRAEMVTEPWLVRGLTTRTRIFGYLAEETPCLEIGS